MNIHNYKFFQFFWLRYSLRKQYKRCINERLNLRKPETFNAKIQWLKLNYFDYRIVICADKYLERSFIKKKGLGNYLPILYDVYESADEINFDTLPNKFVLKCTHGSGYVIICKDKSKLNKKETIDQLNDWMKKKYSYNNGEWFYDVVKPKIIAEELFENIDGTEIIDYKYLCFNGSSKIMFLTLERSKKKHMKVDFYDMEWNKLPFSRHYKKTNYISEMPVAFDKMREIANILAEDFPLVRIDFYYVNNKIYIGEMTFSPGSGLEEFTPAKYDTILGNMIQLPVKDQLYQKKQQLNRFISYLHQNDVKYMKPWK